MKKHALIILLLAAAVNATAQLKTTPLCPGIIVNILEGNVNGIEPDFKNSKIKMVLPCFTSEEADTSTSGCGGMVAYKDKDLYFYTGRGYIEIREKFKGKLSIPLMGASRSSLFNWLGYPLIKDLNWDAFKTAYGILVIHYNKANRINLLQFTKKSTETLKLCE